MLSCLPVSGYCSDFSSQGFALLSAAVLAKIMLIAKDPNLGHWLDERPLIYPALYGSFLFTALFIVFHIVERWRSACSGGTLVNSVPAIGGSGMGDLMCVSTILFVALIPFFAVRNISPALGAGRLNAMLFGAAFRNSDASAAGAERL